MKLSFGGRVGFFDELQKLPFCPVSDSKIDET